MNKDQKRAMDTAAHACALIEKLGGLSAVGRIIGVSRQAIVKWQTHGIPPPHWEKLKAHNPRAGWITHAKAKSRGLFGPRR